MGDLKRRGGGCDEAKRRAPAYTSLWEKHEHG